MRRTLGLGLEFEFAFGFGFGFESVSGSGPVVALGLGWRQFPVANSALTCLAINLPASVISFPGHECLQSKHGYSLISKKQAHRYNSRPDGVGKRYISLWFPVFVFGGAWPRCHLLAPGSPAPGPGLIFSHFRIKLGRLVISCCCFNFSTSLFLILFFYVCFKWHRKISCHLSYSFNWGIYINPDYETYPN